jgi:hypothetical protein
MTDLKVHPHPDGSIDLQLPSTHAAVLCASLEALLKAVHPPGKVLAELVEIQEQLTAAIDNRPAP